MDGLELFPDVAGGYAADARGPLGGEHDGGLLLRALGAAALALGLAGVVLPLLPTTPFVLLAAWAFGRSSPRLRAALENHPRLGPPLRAWNLRRAIPRRAKAAAVGGLGVSWLTLAAGAQQALVAVVAGALMLTVGAWILTRPS